ncbi:MAG: restriction endonuclease subunit S [Burkholderiales bacterium]|nr:restriction endonuclease subunit S [Rhodocyclaceae bacterium]MCA3052194.1 restriction endonuclease subunit S [Rhodocyclaceae bacterium]
MSIKTKSSATKKEVEPVLVPKLRFPEFRGVAAWEPTTLGEKSYILKGKGISKADLDPNGSQACIRYGELYTRYGDTIREVVSRTNVPASELFLSKPDDVVIPSSGETKIDIAKASCVFAGGIALGGDLNVIRSKLNGTFLSYYLNGPKRLDIAKVAQGDTVVHLYPHQLEALQIAVPQSSEQQKIAECLSSVDELMAAQARKVDALKTHKKGLMQQLFPREGESQPRLRFPEFQNAGEWEETRLGRMGELISGLTYSPEDVRESGLLVLRSSNVQQGEIALDDCVYVDPSIKGANRSQPNDILICVRNGSKALIGKCALIPEGMPLCTHGAFMTVFRAQTPGFVFQLFQSSRYQKQVAGDLGATINSINGSQLLKYEFFVPKASEQKRIASFLQSVDALMSAETQKLEALKTHKKGLMQQLFPSALAGEA